MNMESSHLQPQEEEQEEDVGKMIRNRYANSAAAEHRHLCAVAGAMAQILKDENLPALPSAYFAATMNSINNRLQDADDSDVHVTTALCTFLSILVSKLTSSLLTSKAMAALEVLLCLHTRQAEALPPGAVKSIMKCDASLLSASVKSESCTWPLIAPAFNILLNYSLDKRPKVRRCGQECLQQVLNSFQGSSVLGRASKAIYTLFRESLPSGNKVITQIDSNEELKVLHILNTLKLILPFLSAKIISKLLQRLKVLVDIRQSLLMRHILSVLQALCSCASAEIPATELGDVLDSISLSISSCKKKPIDETVFVASFLKHGMQKLHVLDRNLCAAKLPSVFHSVAEILAIGNKEAVSCAADTMKGLIQICIDEDMVLEGVNHLNSNKNIHCEDRTPIECICNSAEIIIDKYCGSTCNITFQVISDIFSKLGESSFFLMDGSLKRLSTLQKRQHKSLQYKEQLHRCVGSAVAAMGPDKFLHILPLNFDDEELMETNAWILPILKKHIIGAHLQFFMVHIFPLAKRLREKSSKLSADGKSIASQEAEAYVWSLWDLLPSFCNYPRDTAESFGSLAHIMMDTLKEEPKLHPIIASSLQLLVKQNKEVQTQETYAKDCHNMSDGAAASEFTLAEKMAKARYTKKVSLKNIKIIASFASELLAVLSNILFSASQDKHKELQDTIGCIASISRKSVVKDTFASIVQRYQVAQDPNNISKANEDLSTKVESMDDVDMKASFRLTLLDLGLALVQVFDEDEVQTLYDVAKLGVQGHDGLAQEKAYKVFNHIFKEHMWFLSEKFFEVVEVMLGAKSLPEASIKRQRLQCLQHLILHILKGKDASASDTTFVFLGEIILTLKNSIEETRTFTYGILVEIASGLNDVTSGNSNEALMSYFNMIVGFLVGTNSHMISAAITGLARLIYEFSEFCLKVPNLLPSAVLLLHSKNREVVKSALGFVKVVATKLQAEDLKQYLPDMVKGLLLWSDDSKNHFKLKVHVVLEILVRKCGPDSVTNIMPQKHMELFKTIIKQKKEKGNWNKPCSQDPESGASFHLHANIERSSSSQISRKRRVEESASVGKSTAQIGLNGTMVTKKQQIGSKRKRHHRDTHLLNNSDGRSPPLVKDKTSASRKKVQAIPNSETNISHSSPTKLARHKIKHKSNKRKSKRNTLH